MGERGHQMKSEEVRAKLSLKKKNYKKGLSFL